MSEQVHEFFGEEPTPADVAWFNRKPEPPSENGTGLSFGPQRPWQAETWAEFRDTAEEDQRWLVNGLLPEGALAFIAAPPKKGKTWLALALALAVATGRPLFQEYAVDEARPVLYVALEGSRSAIRARTGALARGIHVDPESDALEHLHVLYRPRPFDLAQPDSAAWLLEEQMAIGAAFVIVDVLRAAARFRENVAEDFAVVREAFYPLTDEGCTVALLHHFGKLSDTQRDRTPGERMAGTGAMYGALDVGFLITQSENGARRLRVDVEARDFAAPDAIGVVIEGTGGGEHGGFRYMDTATFVIDASAAEERDLVAEIEELFSDNAWRTTSEVAGKDGVGADPSVVRKTLRDSTERFVQITGEEALAAGRQSKSAKPWGTIAMHQMVISTLKSPKSPGLLEDASPGGDAGGVPYGDNHPDTTSSPTVKGDPQQPNHRTLEEDDGIPF